MMERIQKSEDKLLYYKDVEGPKAKGLRRLFDANIIDLQHMINWIYVNKLDGKVQYKLDDSREAWLREVRKNA